MLLSSLPLEILQHVAIWVEAVHRPSINAFSLMNRICHEASLFIRFQRISIAVHEPEDLQRDVAALTQALSRTDSFRHVRQITIRGVMKLKEKRIEVFQPESPWIAYTGLAEILDEDPVHHSALYAVYDDSVIKRSSEQDVAWTPIVNLLKAGLPLMDLIFDCESQFPPCLLDTLHRWYPQCRLHHLTFKFRTLLWGGPYPYEMELATSPSLYRIKATCSQRDSEGDDDFNLEAILELSAGLAPNLKEVFIRNLSPGRSLSFRRPRGAWQGLPGFFRGQKGSLRSLSLKGVSQLWLPERLQDWARHIDLARLQQLTLGGGYELKSSGLSGETMTWVAQTHSFPHVRTLCVYLTRDDLQVERPGYSEQAIAFFQTFESLETLSIDGPIDRMITDSIMLRFGQTLRKLHLRPFEETTGVSNYRQDLRDIPFEFTRDRILQIAAQCPALEDLTIPVKRDRSSASEVERYTAFGKMQKLRSLFLILDCSNWRVYRDPTYDPEFDDEGRKPYDPDHYAYLKKGHVRETFINCAIDEPLAHAIWQTISQHKLGKQLERLKLWPTGEGTYGAHVGLPPTFTGIAGNMARSWLFERSPRDDSDEVSVRELRRAKRKALDQREARYLAYGHNPEVWSVFRSIWPSKEGSRGWWDDWSSVPVKL